MASRQATEASHRVTLSSLDVVTRQEIAEALDAFAAAAVERERAITHFRDLTLVRNAALEEAARLVDHHPFADHAETGAECAALASRIRALKTTT